MNWQNVTSGITDSFTGAPISSVQFFYRCNNCMASYLPDTFMFLKIENKGLCVSCNGNRFTPFNHGELQ